MKEISYRFGLNGLAILLLRLIFKHASPVHEGHLKSGLQARFDLSEFEEALTALQQLSYIESLSGGTWQISKPGKEFLQKYDLYEEEELLEGNLIYVILKYLTELNDSITPTGFPRSVVYAAPQQYYGGDAENLNHFLELDQVMKRYVSVTQDRRYAINDAGRSRYQIEQKKRAKAPTFDEYVGLVLSHLEKNPDFVTNILKEHGTDDPTVAGGIEAYLHNKGLIGLTNKGAYLTKAGRAHLVQLTLHALPIAPPSIHINQPIISYGSNNPITTGGAVTIGTMENNNVPSSSRNEDQRKALSISRNTLFRTILAALATIASLVLAYLAWIKH